MAKMLHKNVAQNVTKSCTKLLGTSRSNDVTATRTSLKKSVCAFFQSLSRLFLLTYFAKCTRTLLKLNCKGPLLVQVLHKTRNKAFSRPSRAKTAKKYMYTKKRDARAKLLFRLLNLLIFQRFCGRRVVES